MVRSFLRATLIIFAALAIGFAAWYALGNHEFDRLSARVGELYRAGKYAEATEAAHKLYESLGVPSAKLSLEERIARNRAEAAALIEEFHARHAAPQTGDGGESADRPALERLPVGLRELPPHMQANGEGSH